MFSTRTNFATNDEINRQQRIQDVILFGKRPTTLLEKKAAAISGHPTINPIIQAKIAKTLPTILKLVLHDKNNLNVIKQQIKNYLRTVKLRKGDVIRLNRNLPILTLQPEIIPEYNVLLDVVPSVSVNILEFEYLCFNNRTLYRYLTDTSFAAYLFQNILYSLNVQTVKQLEGNNAWQARLALLLDRTDFNDYVAKTVFYTDEIQYMGVVYDCKFVPKYDVNNLITQESINEHITDYSLINYYYSLDVRRVKQVPLKNIGIFLTFPFKDGHYIQPSGKIVYLNKFTDIKKSVRLTISELCNMSDIEFAIESAARTLTLDDVTYHAIYAKTLLEQAIALMIIRRLIGDILTLDTYRIQIPTELNILSWTKLACSNSKIILPPNYKSKDTPMYVGLIQDIAQSCNSKLGAAMLCSSFYIPEINISNVYDTLTTDAEKYILFTIILQDYTISMYYVARQRLNPIFGRSAIDLSKYPKFTRQYNDTTVSDRLDSLTEPLLAPTDINSGVSICPPYKCMEMYEFTNPQLNDLVKFGDTEMDEHQIANFIALLV